MMTSLRSLGLIALLSTSALAAPGDLDLSFSQVPLAPGTGVRGVAVQADGNLVVSGGWGGIPSNMPGVHRYIARLDGGAGALDANYGTTLGIGTSPRAVRMLLDGKMLVVGEFTLINGVTMVSAARLNADGTLDTSFANPIINSGGGGFLLNAVVAQPDGKIIIGGRFTSAGGVARANIVRLNANGSVDTTFNPSFNGEVTSLALLPDGKIVVVGGFYSSPGPANLQRSGIAILNSDGTQETTALPLISTPLCVAVQGDGKILVGGSFDTIGNKKVYGLARLNTDRTLDTGFTPTFSLLPNGFTSKVRTLGVQADGKIVVGGDFKAVGVDPSQVDTNGDYLLNPDGTFVGSTPRQRVARINPDGSLDAAFNPALNTSSNPNLNGEVLSVAIQQTGKILVGGYFSNVGSVGVGGIVRFENTVPVEKLSFTGSSRIEWLRGGSAPEASQVFFEQSTDGGSTWTLLGGASRITGGWELTGLSLASGTKIRSSAITSSGLNNGSGGLVQIIEDFPLVPPTIVVEQPSGTKLTSDASTVSFGNVVTGLSSAPLSFTVRNSGTGLLKRLQVGIDGAQVSEFALTPPAVSQIAPGGIATFSIVFTPGAKLPRNASLRIVSNDTSTPLFTVALTGTGIASPNADLAGISLPVPMTISPAFAANVTSYTATTVFNRRSVVITPTALNAISGIKVNGNAVTSGAAAAPINLTTGPNIITIVVTSEDGLHTKTYTLTINRATAAVPGELDFGFDPFANAEVLTSAQQFDGKAVIGGRFVYGGADLNEVGNLSRQGLGRITPDGSYDSYNPLFYGGQIYALQLLANGQTLASGSFAPWSGAGSVLSNSIALLNADGSRVATFDPVSDAVALQMVGVSGGKFIIVGDFTWLKPNGAAVQTSRNHIARINADGSLDTAFNPNVNGIVRSVVAQPDGKAVIGGSFTMVGATARINVARITATGDVDATFTVASEVDDRVNCLALQPDGKILVGGVFVAGDGLVRLNANGSLDATFTPQTPTGGRQPLTLALQENGKIIVGGYGDSGRSAIERQNADGTLDTSFAASIADGASPGWVNTISIQDTGRMVVGGRFSSVNGINRRNVARIDGATPQTLAPVTGSLIEWSRGGLPPATATAFDVSSDNGATWTVVDSTGTYVNGVWQGTITTPLPVTGGLLRGRATIAGGQYGEMSFQTPYSLPAADIVVEQPVNTVLTDGDTINFGSLGLNVLNQIPFTVRNAGGQALTGVSVTITGANANQFSVIDQPDTSVAPLDSTTFTIQAKLTALGAKTAILHVASNDPDENPFDITVNATGVAANLPAATTVSATSAFVNVAGNDVVNATLNGMVDANSLPRDVVFDYGPTTAYGTTVPATNPTENGADPVPVTVALTGLLQHTTYHYRVRAVSDLGNATGLDKTFLTPNHAPVAKDDTAINLPSAAVTIDVLDNDSDGDWDNLIISAKSAVTPATAGTMAIVSNQLVFTASAVFGNAANPKATFTYTVSDGFGGTDTGSVTVNPGSATIAPTASPVLTSASQSYTVAITTLGSWAVTEALTWASVSPSKGIGDGVHPQNVIVTVDANPGLAQRGGPTTGVIKIGGVSHTITQAGVLAPVVSPAVLTGTSTGGPFNTVVGDNGFSVTIPCSNFPVTFSVASGTLPPGLILNTTTGVISGIPTTGGNAASPTKAYPLTIKATNAKSSSTTPSFTINVDALPANAVGTFHGYVKPSATARMTPDPHLGGRFEMTTQSNGAFTGQIYEGVAKKSFSGTLFATFATKLRPSLSAPVTGTSYTLDLTLDATNNTLAGTLHDAGTNTTDVSAWRNTWSATAPINKATRFAGQHNFFMQNTDTANGPQGYGYGSFIVSETTGALTITGKLADETKTTATAITTTFIGPQGQVLFYLPLYSNHGACSGILTVDPTIVGDNQTQGSLKWVKPASPSTPKDTVYASGFGPLTVAVEGNPYVAPAKGERVMGAPSSTSANNATLSFTQGGLSPNFTQGLLIKNPSTTGLTNTATVPSPNPNKVAMPVLTAPTGLFNGNFVIAGTAARTAPFYGLIVRDVTGMSDTTKGYGFLLLPSVPTGTETVATSPKLSGRVELAP